MKVNLYFDMDGVSAVFDEKYSPQKAGRKNYFRKRPVNEAAVDLINLLVEEGYDVHICSALCKSKYAAEDKDAWLDDHGVEVPKENRIFIPVGENKADHAEKPSKDNPVVNVLVDDYWKNLCQWKEAGYVPIKYLNGLNDPDAWNGYSVSQDIDAESTKEYITKIVREEIKKAEKKKKEQ